MNNEYSRLKAVKRFIKLDAAIAKDLNDIAALIAQICETPVALVTLVDKDYQLFKAAVGVDMPGTPRDVAFCNHTIQQQDIVIVPDLTADGRFSANPLIASSPNARFYAAAPLITDDGYAVGTLCVVDFKPMQLNEEQQKALKTLSKQVINLLQLDWSLRSLEIHHKKSLQQKMIIEQSEIKLKAIFDSSSDMHILVGHEFEIMAFNKAAAYHIYNIYRKQPAVGDNVLNYIDDEVGVQLKKYLLAALDGRSYKEELHVRPGTAYEGWREMKLIPIKNARNEVIGVAINTTDITRRKMQEEQIRVQNEALTRIAIIQSHELRRPVASMLGILEVMKIEGSDSMGRDYFSMMQEMVNELDQKIRMIVKDSETTIHNHLAIVA